MSRIFKSIGLMSGTSMDGIDLALIESDGEQHIRILGTDYLEYSNETRAKISKLISEKINIGEIKELENELTLLHAQLVNSFLVKNKLLPSDIDLIGFHGQTIYHNPQNSITWQIGNSQLLALKTNIKTIGDFRVRDVLEGGEGAPLVPIYHYYLFSNIAKPTLIMNVGGVSNVTYFDQSLDNLLAFDLCFGNAPSNDLMVQKFNMPYDKDGELASKGIVNPELLKQVIEAEIFNRKIPRSYSRNDFDEFLKIFSHLSPPDILANYAQIIAEILYKTVYNQLPSKPQQILLCGGGAKNKHLLKIIQNKFHDIKIATTQDYGFNVDSIEAEAFAFLAIRRILNLPISFSNTSGTKNP